MDNLLAELAGEEDDEESLQSKAEFMKNLNREQSRLKNSGTAALVSSKLSVSKVGAASTSFGIDDAGDENEWCREFTLEDDDIDDSSSPQLPAKNAAPALPSPKPASPTVSTKASAQKQLEAAFDDASSHPGVSPLSAVAEMHGSPLEPGQEAFPGQEHAAKGAAEPAADADTPMAEVEPAAADEPVAEAWPHVAAGQQPDSEPAHDAADQAAGSEDTSPGGGRTGSGLPEDTEPTSPADETAAAAPQPVQMQKQGAAAQPAATAEPVTAAAAPAQTAEAAQVPPSVADAAGHGADGSADAACAPVQLQRASDTQAAYATASQDSRPSEIQPAPSPEPPIVTQGHSPDQTLCATVEAPPPPTRAQPVPPRPTVSQQTLTQAQTLSLSETQSTSPAAMRQGSQLSSSSGLGGMLQRNSQPVSSHGDGGGSRPATGSGTASAGGAAPAAGFACPAAGGGAGRSRLATGGGAAPSAAATAAAAGGGGGRANTAAGGMLAGTGAGILGRGVLVSGGGRALAADGRAQHRVGTAAGGQRAPSMLQSLHRPANAGVQKTSRQQGQMPPPPPPRRSMPAAGSTAAPGLPTSTPSRLGPAQGQRPAAADQAQQARVSPAAAAQHSTLSAAAPSVRPAVSAAAAPPAAPAAAPVAALPAAQAASAAAVPRPSSAAALQQPPPAAPPASAAAAPSAVPPPAVHVAHGLGAGRRQVGICQVDCEGHVACRSSVLTVKALADTNAQS